MTAKKTATRKPAKPVPVRFRVLRPLLGVDGGQVAQDSVVTSDELVGNIETLLADGSVAREVPSG